MCIARLLDLNYSPLSALNEAKRKILCGKYISYIFNVFSEARDHILILNILFFNKLRWVALTGHKMCIAFLNIAKDCDTSIQVFGQSPVDRM
jgi:hypothetical protein